MLNLFEQALDPHQVRLIHSSLSGGVAYDVGANVGFVSEIYSKNFEQIYAFEPSPIAFPHLLEKAKKLGNITPLNIALSDVDGVIELDIRSSSWATGQLTTTTDAEIDSKRWGPVIGRMKVEARRLDSLSIPFPDHVKIDVEGHEERVLRGGLEKLSKASTIILEAHIPGKTCEEILSSLGFKVLEIYIDSPRHYFLFAWKTF